MIPIAVFASGLGTGFDSIEASIREKALGAKIVALVTDRPEAPVVARAKRAGVETLVIPFPSSQAEFSLAQRRRQHEEKILAELKKVAPQFIVMAGYMRVLTSHFIEAFRSERGYTRIVNIHPSLLPSFTGVQAYAQAFRYGAKLSGVTVHLVEEEVDCGPICVQEAFSIEDCQSEREVEDRGHAIEHRLYPETLKWVLTEDFSIERRLGGRLCVCKN